MRASFGLGKSGVWWVGLIGLTLVILSGRLLLTSQRSADKAGKVSLISRTGPLQPTEARIPLDALWELVPGKGPTSDPLYQAVLPAGVQSLGGLPAATLIVGGKTIELLPLENATELQPGAFYLDAGHHEHLPLHQTLNEAGSVRATLELRKRLVQLSVLARGDAALGIFPKMLVSLNGEELGRVDVRTETYQPFVLSGSAQQGLNTLEIEFTNDFWAPPEDRNLYLRGVLFTQPPAVLVRPANKQGPLVGAMLTYSSRSSLHLEYRSAEPAPQASGSADEETWRYYEVGHETRLALALPSPGEARFELPAAAESMLELGFAIKPVQRAACGAPLAFETWLETSSGRVKVDELLLGPHDQDTVERWVQRDLDLSGIETSEAELIVTARMEGLRTALAAEPQSLALLAEPRLTMNFTLDALWELVPEKGPASNPLYQAVLPAGVQSSDGLPAAVLTVGGETLDLLPGEDISELRPGLFYLAAGYQGRLTLNETLNNAGRVRAALELRNRPVQLSVLARGDPALGIFPEMLVSLNDEELGRIDVGAETYQPHGLSGSARSGLNTLEIEFTNDFWAPPEDRNLYVREVLFSQSPVVLIRPANEQGPPVGATLTYSSRPPLLLEDRSAEPASPPRGTAAEEIWHSQEVGDETRRALELPFSGETRFKIPAAGASALRLVFASKPVRMVPCGDPVVLETWLESSRGRVKAAELLLDPQDSDTALRWVQQKMDLSEFETGETELVVQSRSERRGTGGPAPEAHQPLVFLAEPFLPLQPRRDRETHKNVVLISLDTLRGDHVGSYGNSLPTTPHLDRLARESTQFEIPIAQSNWTLPSHASLLTSRYPSALGLQEIRSALQNFPTLADLLKREGYDTKAFVDGGFLSPGYGLFHGFRSYESFGNTGFETILPAVETWLRDQVDEPFFLFLHTYDIHEPYKAPKLFRDRFPLPKGVSDELVNGISVNVLKAYRESKTMPSSPNREQIVNMYDAGLNSTDDRLGNFLALLKELDLWDRTLIIVLSDHGEEFWEHGRSGHGRALFEESIRVPLFIRVPGMPSGKIVPGLVELLDVAPTIYEVLGIDPEAELQGESLLSLLQGGAPRTASAYSETSIAKTLRDPGAKLIESSRDEPVLLFHLWEDPEELADLSALSPSELQRLQLRMHEIQEKNSALREANDSSGSVEMSDELQEELRALGYLE